jgi:flavin-dependent dehydrogenase
MNGHQAQVAIVGAGPGGLAAAKWLKQYGLTSVDSGMLVLPLVEEDMAAQLTQNHCSSTGRISGSTLELARPGHLSHNNLMHYLVEYGLLWGQTPAV